MAVDMGKMLGPLPVGAWAAVIAGGLGIALYTRNTAPAEPAYGEELVPRDTSADPGVGEGPGWVAVPPPTTAPNAPEPVTNEEWGRKAVNELIADGYDPAVSDSAIRKYLGTDKLSAQEYSLVRVALGKLGSPPVPLPPPLFAPPTIPTPKPAPKPAPKPGPKPAPRPKPKPRPKPPRKAQPKPNRVRVHVVRPGDTLSKIARRYYGDAGAWRRIYNANRKGVRRAGMGPGMISNPSLIRPGWRLVIPR